MDTVLDELEDLRLLDESRFIEAFIRARVARGQGPVRISHELRTRGIAEDAFRPVLAEFDDNWAERAREIVARKFGGPVTDIKERARRARFLEFRGFTRAHIATALAEPGARRH